MTIDGLDDIEFETEKLFYYKKTRDFASQSSGFPVSRIISNLSVIVHVIYNID